MSYEWMLFIIHDKIMFLFMDYRQCKEDYSENPFKTLGKPLLPRGSMMS